MKNKRIVTRRKHVKLNKKRVARNEMRKKMRYNDRMEAEQERTKKTNEQLTANKYNAG